MLSKACGFVFNFNLLTFDILFFIVPSVEEKMNFIHKIYDKTLELSEGKGAMFALFCVAFAESSFFPIPPDIMLIPMILATPSKAWKIASFATLASVLGGFFGYVIGVFFF